MKHKNNDEKAQSDECRNFEHILVKKTDFVRCESLFRRNYNDCVLHKTLIFIIINSRKDMKVCCGDPSKKKRQARDVLNVNHRVVTIPISTMSLVFFRIEELENSSQSKSFKVIKSLILFLLYRSPVINLKTLTKLFNVIIHENTFSLFA